MILDEPPKFAVVFVHGFLGNAVKTWLSFQTLADAFTHKYPWWSQSDLFFFDYPDFNQAIEFSAGDLVKFLATIFPHPDHSLFETDLSAENSILHLDDPVIRIRKNFPNYDNLILVGHSEGAVVIRKAIVEMTSECIKASKILEAALPPPPGPAQRSFMKIKKKGGGFVNIPFPATQPPPTFANKLLGVSNYPVLQAQLCLFAPALMGAQPAGLLGILAHKIDVLHYSRAYNDLGQGSKVLTNLQKHTEEYADQYGAQLRSLCARVLWGRKKRSWRWMTT